MAINIIEYNRSYKEELIEFILSIQKNEFNRQCVNRKMRIS
ncbi:Acetyltransferase, GNAT family [Staphylococcus aureus]|nr:Acetyltransferase, GNAT family [Staphylococcus aureus]